MSYNFSVSDGQEIQLIQVVEQSASEAEYYTYSNTLQGLTYKKPINGTDANGSTLSSASAPLDTPAFLEELSTLLGSKNIQQWRDNVQMPGASRTEEANTNTIQANPQVSHIAANQQVIHITTDGQFANVGYTANPQGEGTQSFSNQQQVPLHKLVYTNSGNSMFIGGSGGLSDLQAAATLQVDTITDNTKPHATLNRLQQEIVDLKKILPPTLLTDIIKHVSDGKMVVIDDVRPAMASASRHVRGVP